jgi:hypothetical protein
LSGDVVQVEIRGNRGVIVDISSRAGQAVEVSENKAADAVQFERFVQDSIELGEELFPR